MSAFVYCWTDHKTNRIYVGVHKGHKDDGYICSSKVVKEAIKNRPQDFTRQIIAEGTFEDCISLETSILKSANAKVDPHFYNQHNGDGKFYTKEHSEASKQKMRKKKGPFTQTHRENLRSSHLGQKGKRGESNHFAKYSPQQILEIRDRFNNGNSAISLAKEYGTDRRYIYDIVNNKRWSHI